MSTSELGFLAENLAARYLEKRGYAILELNYRKPWGEIDIVAQVLEGLKDAETGRLLTTEELLKRVEQWAK